MSTIRAVVFDFDGVLADTERLHLAAYQQIFGARHITLTRDDYYSRYLGYDDYGVFRRMSDDFDLALTEADITVLIAEKANAFDSVIAATDVLYPAAKSCVERLATEYPLGICSGAMPHEIETIVTRAALGDYIRFIVAAGDTPRSKPAPDPYARAAALHRLPPGACVAIEDSRWGIVSAKTAGLKCVAITNTYPASELTDADAVIGSLEEFTSELIQQL
jgi:beta-phosphoglucomutase